MWRLARGAGACKQAGLAFDKGKLVGSPERLNLFTLEGDVVRRACAERADVRRLV